MYTYSFCGFIFFKCRLRLYFVDNHIILYIGHNEPILNRTPKTSSFDLLVSPIFPIFTFRVYFLELRCMSLYLAHIIFVLLIWPIFFFQSTRVFLDIKSITFHFSCTFHFGHSRTDGYLTYSIK